MLQITDYEFGLLSELIKRNSGINLKPEKKMLLVGRLNKGLKELGINTFIEYYNYLLADEGGREISKLIDKITTNHTYFMRESEHFKYFGETVLPNLKKTIKDYDLRIWCTASSSGEEPYTLAIIMSEFFKHENRKWDKRLLATDLSLTILEEAKKGCYSKENLKSLPKIWLLNYFEKQKDNNYYVRSVLKKEIVFRRFNLLEPVFPFKKKFHVIFCRNVMIYFDDETRDTLIEKMYDCLEDGGYLFVGHSEVINKKRSGFKYIKPAVYIKE